MSMFMCVRFVCASVMSQKIDFGQFIGFILGEICRWCVRGPDVSEMQNEIVDLLLMVLCGACKRVVCENMPHKSKCIDTGRTDTAMWGVFFCRDRYVALLARCTRGGGYMWRFLQRLCFECCIEISGPEYECFLPYVVSCGLTFHAFCIAELPLYFGGLAHNMRGSYKRGLRHVDGDVPLRPG